MTELIDSPLREQARALATGTICARELAEATLARIALRGPDIRAVVDIDPPAIVAAAAAIDALPPQERAPLAGLLFGVKDIIDVATRPTLCGSHAQDRAPARRDSDCVAALSGAGMIAAAKLATYEYALTGPAWDQPNPPARNPWNTAHITGGSSSGSAAAVAAGMLRVALGTDTGGSIRAPAAYCGVVGLKPTWKSLSMAGIFPLSPSLDCVGPIAACVEDAALVLDALRPGAPPTAGQITRDLTGLSIGYARDWFAHDPACDPGVIAALDDAAACLSRLGLRIDLVTLPDYDMLEDAGSAIMRAEALATHRDGLAARLDAYGADARRFLESGASVTETDVRSARNVAKGLQRAVDDLLGRHAALLVPTTLGPAPAFAAFRDGAVWTAMRTLPFNMTGHPAMSVPCGFVHGLPVGMQLVGRHGDEATLLAIGHRFERSTDHIARPAMAAEPIGIEG